ncbi:hypothetical protein GGF46_003093 [Coemansia sp. RSA 552]|nr:hypothetical protein GGF46_003093 [Coemansia sp. RSA 552]
MRVLEELATDAVFNQSQSDEKYRSFREMLINYYSNTEYYRTPEQILQDERVFFGLVRCRAWMIIPAAVLSQFCLGSLYAWSIFNKPIDQFVFGDPKANQAQITFYIALGMLGTSGAIFGPWIESHSPRMCAIIAACLFFAGHCTAALGLACKEIAMLYFGYGFVGGIGLGVGYVTTIDAVIKWYPHSRGFASGLAVSGFGSGAVAFSSLNMMLVRVFTVPQAFSVLGAVVLVVMLTCAMVMRPPPPDHNLPGVAVDMMDQSIADMSRVQQRNVRQTIKGKSATVGGQTITVGTNSGDPVLIISLSQALASRDFWLLWMAFFVNLVFGVVIISNLASMSTNMFGSDMPASVTIIVSIEGAFNATGRLMMGWVSDWTGRRRTFLFVISLQIAIVACLIVVIPQRSFWSFVVLIWLATFCYGGGVGIIAATVGDMFGAPNLSPCHGVMLTGWSAAAIGGGLIYTSVVDILTDKKGYTLSDPFVYMVNQYWILSLLICGWCALLLMRTTPRERLFPRVHGQICCYTIAGITLRLARGVQQHGLHDYEFLSPADQDGYVQQDGSGNTLQTNGTENSAKAVDKRLQEIKRQEEIGPIQLRSGTTGDITSINTYANIDLGLSLDSRKQEYEQLHEPASEAFNYVSQDHRSMVSAAVGAEGECVQLTCANPPTRRNFVLFNRWRLEHVTGEEVTTIWRMYLSCALLASNTD